MKATLRALVAQAIDALRTAGTLPADLEAEASERSEVTEADLRKAFADFLPATSARERELQILCGVLECTSKELLPAKYRDADRGRLAARIAELKLELRG